MEWVLPNSFGPVIRRGSSTRRKQSAWQPGPDSFPVPDQGFRRNDRTILAFEWREAATLSSRYVEQPHR